MMTAQCPRCSSANVRRSRRHGFTEFLEKVRMEKIISQNEFDQLLRDNSLEYYIPDEEVASGSNTSKTSSLFE